MATKSLSRPPRAPSAGTASQTVGRSLARTPGIGQSVTHRSLTHFVVSRTPKKVSLAPKKSSVRAGQLSGGLTIQIGGARKVSDSKRALLDAAVASVADRIAGVSETAAKQVLERFRTESANTALIDILILGDSDPVASATELLNRLRSEPPAIVIHDLMMPDNFVLEADDADIPAANKAALERAYKRGERSKADILKQPDMLPGEQLAEKLGIARGTVDNRRQEGKLLALDFGTRRGFRYPEWQSDLVQDSPRRMAFENTLQALGEGGPWDKYRFFVQSSPALGGKTPIEALKAGEAEEVVRTAKAWASGEQGGG